MLLSYHKEETAKDNDCIFFGCNDKKSNYQAMGSFNTDRFMNFLNEMIIPEGTVILLDNVSFHHSKVVKALAQQKKWFLLYTPPYSPWYNPIEGAFSIAKRAYYQGKNIEEAFDCVTRSHLEAFMKKSLFIHEMPQQKT